MFRKLSLVTVKELLVYCVLLRVKLGSTIYREENLANETSYIILYGKFLLHNSKLGPIGVTSTGDSLGEEGLLDKKANVTTNVEAHTGDFENYVVRRHEMATAEEESYVLEFT
jgi:hypothetical protein